MSRSFDFTDVVGNAATRDEKTIPYRWSTAIEIKDGLVTATVSFHSTRSVDGSTARGQSIFTFTPWEIEDSIRAMLPEEFYDFDEDRYTLARVHGATKDTQGRMHAEILALLAERLKNCKTTKDADATFVEALSNRRVVRRQRELGKPDEVTYIEKPVSTDPILSRLRLEAMMKAFRALSNHTYVGFNVLRY